MKRLAAMQDWPLFRWRRLDRGLDGLVEVGRGQDDEGVGAAEFEHRGLDQPAGLRGDGAPGGLGPGDGHGRDPLVGNHRFDLLGLDEERLERAAGEACAAHQSLDGHGRLGHVRAVFQQADIARHQGRAKKPEDLPEGKVPRHDREYDAQRIPAHVAVVAFGRDGLFLQNACGVIGVVAAADGAFEHFAAGGEQRFAHLGGEQGGKLFHLVLENAGQLAHAQRAVLERDLAVVEECLVGDGDFGLDGLGRKRLKAAEDFAGGWIDGLNGHRTRSIPLSPEGFRGEV